MITYDPLTTSIINQFLQGVRSANPGVDTKTILVSIDAVCNIGPQWDHYLYEASADFQLTVDSCIKFKRKEKLMKFQEKFLQTDAFVHHEILISHWDVEKSTLNTLSLPESQTGGGTREGVYPNEAYKNSRIQLFGETPKEYSSAPGMGEPTLGLAFNFPKNYTCVFRSEENDMNYNVRSTGSIALVQSEPESRTWKTVSLSQNLDECYFPATGRTTKVDEVNERRIYVKNNGIATTTVIWNERNLNYWLTIVSIPLASGQDVYPSLSGAINGAVPRPPSPRIRDLLLLEGVKLFAPLYSQWEDTFGLLASLVGRNLSKSIGRSSH